MERATMLHIRGSKNNLLLRNHKPLTSSKKVCKRFPVGAPGIEPGTSCTPCKRASRTAADRLQNRFYDVMSLRFRKKSTDVSTLRLTERGQK